MKKIITVILVFIVALTNTLSVSSAYKPDTGRFEKKYIDSIEPCIPKNRPISPNAIIGDESWKDIEDTSAYPYSAIAYIRIYFNDLNNPNYATGFLISKKCLLTAGHIFYHYDNGVLHTADKIVLYFGVPYKATNPENSYTYKLTTEPSTDTYYFKALETYDSSQDYGAIIFGTSLNVNLGNFGMQPYKTNLEMLDLSIKATGYSKFGTNNNEIIMKSDSGTISTAQTTTFHYSCDTKAGMSGSPVYESNFDAVGINVSETANYNVAYRITTDFMNKLQELGAY